MPKPSLFAGLLALALAIVGAGWLLADAHRDSRAADRHVTVKGLSEREVPADLAIWPLTYTVGAARLDALHAELARDEAAVRAFLTEHFPQGEVRAAPPQVEDRQRWGWNGQGDRFTATATVTLRTRAVDHLHDAQQSADDLVEEGVVLSTSGPATQWIFTGLEGIKPDMIAEATRDARRAAEQFARDADSGVGSIRTAQQGYFSISDRDAFSPEIKRVRVVTTVRFGLTD